MSADDVEHPPHHSDNQVRVPDQQDQAQQPNQADLMTTAARLLVEIAGPAPVHIEMSSRGPKKYYDVHRPLEAKGACAHLQGWQIKGGWIRRPDGMTRALAYDADTEEGWEELKTAARFLTYGEYIALLEPSPVGRGGHLWVLYSDLVKARDAQRHVCQYAPMLSKVKESWPGSPNKVRLPGGKYIKPGFAEWCKLYDAHGKLLASNGVEVAQALLTFQNQASMVPAYPPDLEPSPTTGSPESVSVALAARMPNRDDQAHARKECAPKRAGPRVDQYWQQKYGRYLWFQFTPTQLAAWYNARHSVQDVLPPEKNRMDLASWRGEHTASVGYTKDGEGWVDFGASAGQPDGKRDGGDALELEARVIQEPKPEIMREIARTLISEAKNALENAARDGQPPPEWVQAIMSSAGWERYEHPCQQHGHPIKRRNDPPTQVPVIQAHYCKGLAANEQATFTGGVAGYYQATEAIEGPQEQPKAEPCQHSDTVRDTPSLSCRVQDTPEALAAEINAEINESCPRCCCTLYYRSENMLMSHWCYPRPLKFGRLSDTQRDRLRVLFSRIRTQKRIEQQHNVD